MLSVLLAAVPSLRAGAVRALEPSVRAVSVRAVETATPPSLNCEPYDATKSWSPKGEVDELSLLAQNWAAFPISADELINKAKWVLAEPQLGLVDDCCLAEDFEFCAPFIGPLAKEEFLGALGNFKLTEAFPDINENYHAFRADPFQPGRIWWNTRTTASHTGAETPMLGKPSGKELALPPQSFSLIFDEQGLVRELTVGYVVDRRVGNTGGLGGAFGFFYGVGKPLPIPECRPYKPSLQLRFLGLVGTVGKRIGKLFGKGD